MEYTYFERTALYQLDPALVDSNKNLDVLNQYKHDMKPKILYDRLGSYPDEQIRLINVLV